MKLTQEEQDILAGKFGRTLQKVMRTLVLYGEALDAERLVDIEGLGHLVTPYAIPGIGLDLEMADELVQAGCKTKYPFTICPRAPLDFENLSLTPEQERAFTDLFRDQPRCDELISKLGLLDKEAYTCTPYLNETGNMPKKGSFLAWAASCCVVFANSVLGARTNRNSAEIELLSNIVGKTPLIGLLTDAGRSATWLVKVRTSKLPHAQLLGGAIGQKIQEGVPFIVGLDQFLGPGLDDESMDYLKEMGTACATIGAVGLFHVENMTPEALEQGTQLLDPHHQTYIIDDQLLKNLVDSYPVIWEDRKAQPEKCIIGCPHQSLRQLHWWTDKICDALERKRRRQIAVPTIICAAPKVLKMFKADKKASGRLRKTGVTLSTTCPEAYMDNQYCAREAVITNSNKTRAYTSARFFVDEELVEIITSGEIK
jgi:hypothetical protein